MPAVIILEIVADGGDFGGLVQCPIVGRRGIAIEREVSGRPDIDEVVGDRAAIGIEQPGAGDPGAGKNDDKTERQCESDQRNPPCRCFGTTAAR